MYWDKEEFKDTIFMMFDYDIPNDDSLMKFISHLAGCITFPLCLVCSIFWAIKFKKEVK